ncbi:MAG: hypothetical protein KAY12_02050 [Arenimonas sp.]|nr:hypothetical protein [Arenimonas sp.]
MSKQRISAITLLVGAMGLSLSAQAGNGAPSGAHYNLNILGKTTCSGDDLKGTGRHNIQVLLNGGQRAQDIDGTLALNVDRKNKIYLEQTFDGSFGVPDGNACDADGALFRLPAPGGYEIYARALGKPGGAATMTTCATGAGADNILNTADDEIVCSTENVLLVRSTSKSSFTNVTRQLTTITADIDGDGDTETVEIFNTSLYDYFWNYENRGLRLAQLRFYKL